ncbi:glycosyltransferase [Alkalicoccus saliphilus]|uniref:Glycosyltransferase n=1 Tax=Alkalicoccus saliphilus TaxID=200989 RepID=A0A2T4U3E3_9BACI|nr:glycosyltransferase [Alkalicoccus saliphilus]PTL37920.1 hypothetical protein C6Y45_14055 [Alkalicoccus saliphilus]
MDILFVTDNNLNTVGGEQESVKIILGEVKKNYETGVLQPGEKPAEVDGVTYFELTPYEKLKPLIKKPLAFVSYLFKAARIIRQTKPKVIHTQAQASFFLVALMKYAQILPGKTTFIHTERGLHSKYGRPLKGIFYVFLRKLDVLVTTTDRNKELWENDLKKFRYGRKLEYRVIENTAGNLFEGGEEQTPNTDGKLHVGFAGRYVDWKNWPLALEISRLLSEKLPGEIKVSMAVGCFEPHTYEEAENMFAEMKALLGDDFHGRINSTLEEMSRFYEDMDVYILTSMPDTESFGRTLVEAMAKNTVALTTNSGGSEEVVGEKANIGRTAHDFVERITGLHHNRDELEKEKNRSRERVFQKYSTANNLDKHQAMYKSRLEPKESGQTTSRKGDHVGVSLVCTVKNGGELFQQTLDSIKNQTADNFELVVVDDGSTDDTNERVQLLAEDVEFGVTLVTTNGVGRGRALNLGVEHAQHDYIMIIDDDDPIHPKKVDVQFQAALNHPEFSVICTNTFLLLNNAKPSWPVLQRIPEVTDVTRRVFIKNPVIHSSVMMKKKDLDRVGRYDESRTSQFDTELWLRFATNGYLIGLLPLPLTAKRAHANQAFENKHNRLQFLKNTTGLQLSYLRKADLPAYYYAFPAAKFAYGLLPRALRIQLRKLTE